MGDAAIGVAVVVVVVALLAVPLIMGIRQTRQIIRRERRRRCAADDGTREPGFDTGDGIDGCGGGGGD
jgi:hypothetical protein